MKKSNIILSLFCVKYGICCIPYIDILCNLEDVFLRYIQRQIFPFRIVSSFYPLNCSGISDMFLLNYFLWFVEPLIVVFQIISSNSGCI